MSWFQHEWELRRVQHRRQRIVRHEVVGVPKVWCRQPVLGERNSLMEFVGQTLGSARDMKQHAEKVGDPGSPENRLVDEAGDALGVMCRNLLSVDWRGQLYDCDFNQALELPQGGRQRSIWDIKSFTDVEHDPIVFGDHCYGCTAGAGSSCGGSLA